MNTFARDIKVGDVVAGAAGALRTVVAVGEDAQGEAVLVLQSADMSVETIICGPFASFVTLEPWVAGLLAE